MTSKRVGSKDTIERSTGDVVEQGFMSIPMYRATHLLIEKDIQITWKDINTIFLGSFEENMEDRKVYVNIHNSRLCKVSCKFLVFPWVDVIHWIISYIDIEMMILSSASGAKFSSFSMEYH